MFALTLLALAVPADPIPVPADALAVVQLRGLGHLRERAAGLLAAVVPEQADRLALQLDQLTRPDGRDLTVLDPTGRVYLAVLRDESLTPTWALYLPVRDYHRFRSSLLTVDERAVLRPGPHGYDTTELAGGPVHLLDRTAAGYVVLTPSEPAARWLTTTPARLPAETVGGTAGPFLGSDLGVYVNLPAVTARYGALMTGTRLMLPGLLASGAFGLPRMEPRQADQIATVVNAALQAVADGKGLTVGLNLGPAGVTVDAALAVRPGTATARLLGSGGGPATPLLDALPGGQAVYTLANLSAETLAGLDAAFPEFQTADDTKMRGPAKLTPLRRASAGVVAGPMLELVQATEPVELVVAHLARVRAITGRAAHLNVPLAGTPRLLPQAKGLGHLVFDRVILNYDLAAATAGIADHGVRQAAHDTMRHLVGDRSSYWLAADADQVVRVTAADWSGARSLVTAYLERTARATDDPEVRALRPSLPADATALAMVDAAAVTCRVGSVLHGVVNALPAFPGLELPAFVPPAGRSSFLGVAVITRPQSVQARVVLPAAALRAAAATVRLDPAP